MMSHFWGEIGFIWDCGNSDEKGLVGYCEIVNSYGFYSDLVELCSSNPHVIFSAVVKYLVISGFVYGCAEERGLQTYWSLRNS